LPSETDFENLSAMSCPAKLIFADLGIIELHNFCTLGRDSGNMVKLEDNHASKFHAIIQRQGEGECWLVDLGSSNGTYVNGRRLTKSQVLRHGDEIQVGATKIIFESEATLPDGSSSFGQGSHGATHPMTMVRPLWLLVADIVGSTRMVCDLPPEQVAKITGEWFKTCRAVLERHDAHMNQYLGDGFLCYWEDTLDIRFRIIDAMRELARMQVATQPPFRFVLHHGRTLLSGVPTLTVLSLHGDTVHFTFRMEKIAGKADQAILCSEIALEKLKLNPLTSHEAAADGFAGSHRFFVPDLA
jgi:adenylate cyclase